MEIQCPGCTRSVDYNETADEIVCPHCRRTLEITLGHEGFALVSALDQAPDESGPVVPLDDPIIEDYTRWRSRAVFIMLFGAVCTLILTFSIIRGVMDSGMYYFHNPKNQFFAGVFCILSVGCVAGGAWLFRYLGRERDRYMDMMPASTPVKPGKGQTGIIL